jgi:hypothetical protein
MSFNVIWMAGSTFGASPRSWPGYDVMCVRERNCPDFCPFYDLPIPCFERVKKSASGRRFISDGMALYPGFAGDD